MRHRVYGRHLGRNKDERRSLFKGLVRSLLLYGTIQTSEARAKAIKGLVDKIINSAKSNSRSGNLVQSFVVDKDLRERLIKEIVPKLGARTSGFTSIVRMGTQLGDQSTIVRMSLIGAEQLKPIEKGTRAPARGEVRQREQGLGISKKPVQTKKKEEKKSILLRKGRPKQNEY